MRSFLILVMVALIQASVGSAAAAQGPGPTAIPRTPDGKPDLSGIWQVVNTAAWDIQDHAAQKGAPGGQGVVTVEDPKVFTRPWNMSMILYRHKEKNFRLFEYECYGFDFEKLYPYPDAGAPR